MQFIFCCGMKRSGSTLHYNLVSDIVEGSLKGDRLGYIKTWQDFEVIAKENYNSNDSLGIIKSHEYFDQMRELESSQRAYFIYIHRDIRDVAVSLLNKLQLKSQTITFQSIQNSIEKALKLHYQFQNNIKNLYSISYEQVISNLEVEVYRLANFLGIKIDKILAKQISANRSLENQKENLKTIKYNDPNKIENYDPETLLHPSHINSGKIGQWQNTLTKKHFYY